MRESITQRLVGFSIRHSWFVILLTTLLTLFLGYNAFRIQIDSDIFNLLPRNSRVLELAAKYGTSSDTGQILLAVESPDLFDLEKLQLLESVIRRIEALDGVGGSINPFNFITFEQEGKKLKPVPAGIEGRAPRNQEELEEFRDRLLGDPLTRNLVLASDGSALCTVFPVQAREDYTEMIRAVEDLLPSLESYFNVYMVGAPVFIVKTKLALLEDVPKFLIVSVLIILVVLFFSFSTIRSLLLPMLVVGFGTLWTMGTMALLGIPLTVVGIMVPPLVLTLGSAYSIHVLNQYYREARVTGGDKSWIAQSVGHINQTILMAALTTIIGFLSLASANLPQIKEFGISTSIGIAYCALLSMFFLPAVLSLLPAPKSRQRDRVLRGLITRFMERLSGWVIRHRYLIVTAVVLVVAAFGLTLKNISYQTDYLSYYRKKHRVVQDSEQIVRRFGGYTNVYITMEAPPGQPNFFLEPAVLERISEFENKLERDPDICYIFSFTQYLKLINLKSAGTFTIPDSRAPILLLSRYMKSIASSPYGQSIEGKPLSEDFSTLTISLRAWDGDRKRLLREPEFKALVRRLEVMVEDELDVGAQTIIWGRALGLLYISETLSRDQIYSVVVSVVLIFLVTAIGFRSLRLGLLTLIPLATGIMLNFIIMIVLKLPFDVVTVMFSSVAIGVGIDNSIHLIIRYRRQMRIHDQANDVSTVLAHTLKTAGRPILLTTLSLVSGLLALCFSQFLPIFYFGILVSLALLTTTSGALIILPAILSLRRNGDKAKRPRSAAL